MLTRFVFLDGWYKKINEFGNTPILKKIMLQTISLGINLLATANEEEELLRLTLSKAAINYLKTKNNWKISSL